MKKLLLITSFLFVSSAVAQTTLSLWSWRTEDRAAYEQLIKDFERKNPDIKVNFIPYEATSYNTVLSTALAGGKGPDLMMVRAYGGLEQLAKAGYLEPITNKFPDLKNFSAESLAAQTLRADKQLYAVPFATQTLGLFYNKSLFDKLKLQAPRTWNDLTNAGEKLKAAGYIPFANGTKDAWQGEIMMGVFGPNIYGQDFYQDIVNARTDFEDPRFVNAIRKLQELKPLMPQGFTAVDYTTAQQLFTSERAAMFAGGSFEIANFRKQNPNLKFAFVPAPTLKSGDPRMVSLFGDGGYAVNAKSPNKKAALKFLEYTASRQFGQKFTDLLANVSPMQGVVPSDPMVRQVMQYNKSASPYIMLVNFRYNDPTGSTLLQQALQKAFAGDMTPEQAARHVTQGMSGYFKKK
ncbi:extracellular solute-binding protein [Deinococcus peraridilitoris]|uniref:ABC-type sugar transport system, periplasmic component n=1 Tax=Deinococcus peraridilitoris (strain DSM 19664 / LMG 22246 / CIP 109416 / KR-200) TaxID=937777 RepID=L0A904_DEIPD|nr:extracellular solute-binding protein [Deinococcus peraridilitoris]AFZ69545.1 ABC-type sugar transport system, periplasmic component [Deinococcus peraridilitoris DSM 19664]